MRSQVTHKSASRRGPAARANKEITISHPDRLIFAEEKITKSQIADYYKSVAEWMLPHISDRPLAIIRCPQSTLKSCFLAKHFAERFPESVIPVGDHANKPFFTVNSVAGLISLVQYGTVEIHYWGTHRKTMDHPDQIIWDIDPDPDLPFKSVRKTALELRERLDQLKLETFLKMTGGKGLHVQAPCLARYGWEEVKEFSHNIVREMIANEPDLYTDNMSKAARKGKIFLDYLRNAKGSIAIAPYSLRAKAVSSVAMPLAWSELDKIDAPNHFTLQRALAFLIRRKKDPWQDYLSMHQKISWR